MRKLFILIIIFLYPSLNFSQTTIVLQPNETSSKDAVVWNINPTTNYGNHPDFIATAWTNGGSLSIIRGLIDFDLASIPENATILNATLSLYYHSSTSNIGHSQMNGSNACWLRRVISPWDEAMVTWNNQPSTTTQNQINIPESLNDTINYPNIDVTLLIKDIYNNPSTSHGLMLLLQTEYFYRSLLFASSGETDVNKRPKLTITYLPKNPSIDTCIVINPLINNYSKDAAVWNIEPTTNYGNHPDFIATAWTYGGNLSIIRGLIDFDLSSIPFSAKITNATLKLYHYSSTSNIGHSTLSGSNDSWLRRITSSWDEGTVTWNNQPSYTTQNEVHLPATTNDTMNYPNIDVTNLIKDIWSNPSSSYGMMLMLNNESNYRSMLFGSRDCPDQSKIPLLEICYYIDTLSSVPELSILDAFSLYPNPTTDNLTVETHQNSEISILNIQGQLLKSLEANSNKTNIDVSALPNGIYIVQVKTEKGMAVKKFVKK